MQPCVLKLFEFSSSPHHIDLRLATKKDTLGADGCFGHGSSRISFSGSKKVTCQGPCCFQCLLSWTGGVRAQASFRATRVYLPRCWMSHMSNADIGSHNILRGVAEIAQEDGTNMLSGKTAGHQQCFRVVHLCGRLTPCKHASAVHPQKCGTFINIQTNDSAFCCSRNIDCSITLLTDVNGGERVMLPPSFHPPPSSTDNFTVQ